MKLSSVLLLNLPLILAAPYAKDHHQHQHQHLNKRDVVTTFVYVDIDGNTVEAPATATEETSSSTSSPTTSTQPATTTESNEESDDESTSSTQSSSGSSSTGSSDSGLSGIFGDLKAFVDPSSTFEDGTVKCSDFPKGNGVIALDWVSGIDGGWSSIMDMDGQTSSECKDGFYCSYACQAGMSKTQWPSKQPSNGISVGGLLCKDGYLYKSNKDKDHLCEWGSPNVNFVSNIDKEISICRTDYPGSESMVVPTVLSSKSKAPVSVVNSDSYYTWKGGKTSTQYYVNDAGVSVEDGCIWGTEGSGVGNWAPVVLGAGTTNGKTYLSLIPNPNNKKQPNYNIKIEGDDGASVNGDCKYEDGKYNGHGSDGCTVTLSSGNAKFVFY